MTLAQYFFVGSLVTLVTIGLLYFDEIFKRHLETKNGKWAKAWVVLSTLALAHLLWPLVVLLWVVAAGVQLQEWSQKRSKIKRQAR